MHAGRILATPANGNRVPSGLLYLSAIAAVFTLAGCGRAQAVEMPGGDVERGRATIAALPCGSCHTIAGIRNARGLVGPPLTGIASRSMIAGELPNTPENLVHWVQAPKSVEPNTAMPALGLTDQQARDVAAYLYTLR